AALEPFEAVRRLVERELGPVKRIVKHAALIRREEPTIVLEYVVEIKEGEVSVKVVCAKDPRGALEEYCEAKRREVIKLVEVEEGSYLNMIETTLRANFYNVRAVEELERAEEEIVELANDVIDYWPTHLPEGEFADLAIRSAFLFSLLHVVWPLSNGVLLDLLAGNLPACFMQLRLIVETAAKSLAVDYALKFRGESLRGVEALEEYLRKGEKGKPISTAKFLRDMFPDVVGREIAEETLALWSRLSEDWIHFRGIARRVRERVEERGGPIPSYILALPIELDERDAEDLAEFARRVAEVRKLLKALRERWWELVKEHYLKRSFEDSSGT
ncbi:MAG: hypothetical protein DRK00_10875, partial [Thermoprotei archaeon]